jgi:eukaryotic-like serine/threonine-protein kinase
MNERSEKIDQIFAAALEISDTAERESYVRSKCGRETGLRREVESLLAAHARSGTFLEEPVAGAPFAGPSPNSKQAAETGSPTLEKSGDQIDRFKLLEQIGHGGFGVVWMAQQEEPVRRRVALKVIKLGMDTKQVIARFEAERQALALMDHPNIAQVFDGGATNTGRPYFVMELVRGVKITDYYDQNHLTTKERLHLFIQVCGAIQHAHQKGIIHRDIKPSNILVTLHDGVPVPKVIDFGIAKAIEGRLTDQTLFTQFNAFLGTPAYISPEQTEIGTLDIDTRSDIYSLGVLLYELLTGKTPLESEELLRAGLDQMRRMIREKEPKKPSTRLTGMHVADQASIAQRHRTEPAKLIHQVRGDLDWIVMKCLEKERSRRYETANDLASDLHRHLKKEPVLASPPSQLYRAQKAFQRNKVAFVAALGISLALMIAVVVSTWQARRVTRALAKEARQRERAEINAGAVLLNQYAAEMNLAQLAWQSGDIARIRQGLNDTRQAPYLGFEWYFWQRLVHLDRTTLRGHGGAVTCLAYSPDGRHIVTGSAVATVWSVTEKRMLFDLHGDPEARVWCVAFSPDGRRIATGSDHNFAGLWDAHTGELLLTLPKTRSKDRFENTAFRTRTISHSGPIATLAFSPDGGRVVTGSQDKTAIVWDSVSGDATLELVGHQYPIESVAYSPDGKTIATASFDRTAKLWDAQTGREKVTFTGHTNAIVSMAFSPDGKWLLTGSDDDTTRIWSANDGRELNVFRGPVKCVAVAPNGRKLATGSGDGTATVIDIETAHVLLRLKGHVGAIEDVAFAPDGMQIATASNDETVKIWDADVDHESLILYGHSQPVQTLAFSPDNTHLVTGGRDLAIVWQADTGKQVLTFEGHKDWINCASFTPDSLHVITGSSDGTAKIWNAETGRQEHSLEGHEDSVISVCVSPDGKRVLTGTIWQVRVWNAADGSLLSTIHDNMLPGEMFAGGIAILQDNRRLATANRFGVIRLWDMIEGRELFRVFTSNSWNSAFTLSPDETRFALATSNDKAIRVWELATGKRLLSLKGLGYPGCLRYSPDGGRILSAWPAKLWDAGTGRELLSLWKGSFAAFSPDGRRIAAASGHQVIIWTAASKAEVEQWWNEERLHTLPRSE